MLRDGEKRGRGLGRELRCPRQAVGVSDLELVGWMAETLSFGEETFC